MIARELLEKAARAAGIKCRWQGRMGLTGGPITEYFVLDEDYPLPAIWNPLTDDGDALRLAVKLEFSLYRKHGAIGISCPHFDGYAWQSFDNEADDRVIAKETRCAITYAAAIIGANDGL